AGYTVLLSPREVRLNVRGERGGSRSLQLRLGGASGTPSIEALEPLAARSHYYRGHDPRRWITGVPHYAPLRCGGVSPGTGLVFYGTDGALEYDFTRRPHAAPDQIRMELVLDGDAGPVAPRLEEGALVLASDAGTFFRLAEPLIYQEQDGRRTRIAGAYTLQEGGQVGITVGDYDR